MPESNPPILRIENLSVSFGGNKALTEVNLSMHKSQVLVVIGGNGSGKTTLLNAICGLVTTTGRIQFMDQYLTDRPAWSRSRTGFARTFQSPRIFNRLTVDEECTMVSHTSTLSPEIDYYSRFRNLVRSLAMVDDPTPRHHVTQCYRKDTDDPNVIDRDDQTLSEFYRLRVRELSRVLSGKPPMAMLDEPLSGLAKSDWAGFKQAIRRLAESGSAVLLVEHHIQEALSVADQVLKLDRGKAIFLGSLEEYSSTMRSV